MINAWLTVQQVKPLVFIVQFLHKIKEFVFQIVQLIVKSAHLPRIVLYAILDMLFPMVLVWHLVELGIFQIQLNVSIALIIVANVI